MIGKSVHSADDDALLSILSVLNPFLFLSVFNSISLYSLLYQILHFPFSFFRPSLLTPSFLNSFLPPAFLYPLLYIFLLSFVAPPSFSCFSLPLFLFFFASFLTPYLFSFLLSACLLPFFFTFFHFLLSCLLSCFAFFFFVFHLKNSTTEFSFYNLRFLFKKKTEIFFFSEDIVLLLSTSTFWCLCIFRWEIEWQEVFIIIFSNYFCIWFYTQTVSGNFHWRSSNSKFSSIVIFEQE